VLPLEQPRQIVDRLVVLGAEQVEVQGTTAADDRKASHA
jgi:hypothetical protein